jgi:hypothetical protein
MKMPNWFKNHVALKGDPARIAAFKQAHFKTRIVEQPESFAPAAPAVKEVETYLDFETIIPLPENIKALKTDLIPMSEILKRRSTRARTDEPLVSCRRASSG